MSCPDGSERKDLCTSAQTWEKPVIDLCSGTKQADAPKWELSAMWRGFQQGSAQAELSLITGKMFNGQQASRIKFAGGGSGAVGVLNYG